MMICERSKTCQRRPPLFAADAPSNALAAAGDSFASLARYQIAEWVSATTAGIKSHPWGNSSTFPFGPRRCPRRSNRYSGQPKGHVRSSGASAVAMIRREGASHDPRPPAACLLEAPGRHRESLVRGSSECPPLDIIRCFRHSEKGMGASPLYVLVSVLAGSGEEGRNSSCQSTWSAELCWVTASSFQRPWPNWATTRKYIPMALPCSARKAESGPNEPTSLSAGKNCCRLPTTLASRDHPTAALSRS